MKASPTLDLELEAEALTPAAPAQALTQAAPTHAHVAVQPAPQSEAGAMLAMIERAARDPAVDLEKIERLWALSEQAQNRAEDRASRREFNEAIAAAKSEIGPIKKNKHVGFESETQRRENRLLA